LAEITTAYIGHLQRGWTSRQMAHHDFERRPFALNSGRVRLAGGIDGRKTVVMIDALTFL